MPMSENHLGGMAMELFRQDNTEGFAGEQLDALNAEWKERAGGLEFGTDEYDQAAKAFCDEVARRV